MMIQEISIYSELKQQKTENSFYKEKLVVIFWNDFHQGHMIYKFIFKKILWKSNFQKTSF